jgi:hypothetical protein
METLASQHTEGRSNSGHAIQENQWNQLFIKNSIPCKCGTKMMVDTWIISDAGTNALIVAEMDTTLIQP